MTELSSFDTQREGASRYVAAIREHWLLILVLVAVSVASAAAYSLTATKKYKSEADLLVNPIAQGDTTYTGLGLLTESNALGSGVLTAARLVQTPQVAQGVKDNNDFGMSRDALLGSIAVTPLSQSNIVAITATAPGGHRAAQIANAFAHEAINQRTERFQKAVNAAIARAKARLAATPAAQTQNVTDLRGRISLLETLADGPDPTLTVASGAVAPGGPAWPRPKLSIAVALLVALLLGIGAALALEVFNPRINREEELLLNQRLPILARVPRVRTTVASRYLTRRGKLPPHIWEAYRTLRASLTGAGPDGGFPRKILVTSAIPGEAKTMTSVNFAVTLALSGVRVILVDADLRRPMIATVFGAAARTNGFGLLLVGNASPETALLQAPGNPNLQLLLSNPQHAHLVDLLQRHRIETVLDQLLEYADVVVVDSPPLTEVADALTLADVVDTTLVTVRLGRSRRDKLDELRRALAQRGVSPAGFVVTARRVARRKTYGYGYQGGPRLQTAVEPAPDPLAGELGEVKTAGAE
jgi:receptor protein-tyrosine kinase/non-specific protein-tyrosine kinase